jgi:hypothetical protein
MPRPKIVEESVSERIGRKSIYFVTTNIVLMSPSETWIAPKNSAALIMSLHLGFILSNPGP